MRRVMRENLERREREAEEGRSREEEAIGRLRREGSRLVEEEQEEVLRRMDSIRLHPMEGLVKVKWARGVEGYTEAELRQVLLKYGDLATVVVGGRREEGREGEVEEHRGVRGGEWRGGGGDGSWWEGGAA